MSAEATPIQRYLNQGPDVRHLGEKDVWGPYTIMLLLIRLKVQNKFVNFFIASLEHFPHPQSLLKTDIAFSR